MTETTTNSCVFNWQTHKSLGEDSITYTLQLQIYRKESDYTNIYNGELTSYRATNLKSGVEYRARVCVVRTTNKGLSLNSPFSPATHFVLPRPEDLAAVLSSSKTSDNSLLNNGTRNQSVSPTNRYLLIIYRKFKSVKLLESRTLTDQQWAFVISVGFALLAIFIAVFANVIYSKYNNNASMSVDHTFSSSRSPNIRKYQ